MFSSKSFNPLRDVPDLKGKVILVTGGNSGIGFATIQYLARRGAKVYLGARDETKAQSAIEKLKEAGLGPGEVHYAYVDMSDAAKAKAAAEDFLQKETRLDVLINNAAQTLIPYAKSHHDVVNTMVINYLGPVAFTHTLLPLLEKTGREHGQDARIVNVSSDSPGRVPTGKRFRNRDDFNEEYKSMMLPEFGRYGQSKLAFLIWSKELQRRLTARGSPIVVLSPNPGATRTPSSQGWMRTWNFVMSSFLLFMSYVALNSPEKSAHVVVFAAASPVVHERASEYGGAFLAPSTRIDVVPNKDAESEELAKELWSTTDGILTEVGAWKDIA